MTGRVDDDEIDGESASCPEAMSGQQFAQCWQAVHRLDGGQHDWAIARNPMQPKLGLRTTIPPDFIGRRCQ